MYQPKTGVKCGCRRGVQRDNCSTCEGTGMVIDFVAIREVTSISSACDVNDPCPDCDCQKGVKP